MHPTAAFAIVLKRERLLNKVAYTKTLQYPEKSSTRNQHPQWYHGKNPKIHLNYF